MLSQELVSDIPEKSQENNDRASEARSENYEGGIDGDGSENGFRVRNVSEINGSAITSSSNGETEATSGTGKQECAVKRKLPTWMMTVAGTSQQVEEQEAEASSSKRSKLVEIHVQEARVDIVVEEDESTNEGEAATEAITGPAGDVAEEDESTNEGEAATEASTSAEAEASSTGTVPQVKDEPADEADSAGAEAEPSCSSTISKPAFDIKPAVKVEKADASSTSRESCRFGIRCYRRNPMHRIEEAHPGDHDYKRPNFPTPPLGTPPCPFGNSCYRRNPVHFQQCSHPPDN